MSKRLLAVALALMFVLGLSGLAMAMTANISQDGVLNFAFVGQSETVENDLTLTQNFPGAWLNVAFVVQHAPVNTATIAQEGFGNFAYVSQTDANVYDIWYLQEHIDSAIDQFLMLWMFI